MARSVTFSYLWRAVDHEDQILESFFTRVRDADVALSIMTKTLKGHGFTGGQHHRWLAQLRRGMDELGNPDQQEIGRWANNRVKNGHLSFWQRERAMPSFTRMKLTDASVHASVHDHFDLERHLVDRQTYKERRSGTLAEWSSFAS